MLLNRCLIRSSCLAKICDQSSTLARLLFISQRHLTVPFCRQLLKQGLDRGLTASELRADTEGWFPWGDMKGNFFKLSLHSGRALH